MKVPKFFSRTVILAGSPFWAGADDAADQARLQAALRELVRQADRFSGADQTFPDPMLGK
jgi:lysophospholipid acyltransferase (LPLAT)-like uncharacterized protein